MDGNSGGCDELTSGSGPRPLAPSERSLSADIRRVARSSSQGGMTLDDDEVRTLSGLLRRVPGTALPIALDVHRVAASPAASGMTLEDDEVQALASVLGGA
jgi:hypothetical protein